MADSEASSSSSESGSGSDDDRHPADELIINKAVRRSKAATAAEQSPVPRSPPGLSENGSAQGQTGNPFPEKPPGLGGAAPPQNGRKQLSWQKLAVQSVVGSAQVLEHYARASSKADAAAVASQGKAKKAQASKKRTRAAKEGGAAAGDGEQEAKQKRKRPKKSHSGSQRESSSSDIDAASGELSGSDDERDLERRIDAQTTLAKAAADADASAPVGVTVIPDDVEVDNAAMQKLLRAPRYFDVDFEDTAFKCFKCGGRGHMARDCPNQERQKPCFLCAQFGHTRQNCPNRISGVICFKCNRAGHLARDCPGGTQTGPQLQRLCQRCGFADCEAAAEGDLYRAEGGCSRSYSESDLQHVRCYVCGAKGHLCCQPSPATKLKQTCYNCGEGGHTADECYKDAMPGVEAERRGRPNDRNFNRLAAPGRSTPMDYDYPRSAGSGRSTPVDYSAYTNTREAWSSPAYAAQPAARSGAYASYAAQAVYGGGGSSYSQRVVAMQAHTAGGGVYSQQAYASGATYATPPQLQPQYGTPGSQSGGSGGGYRRGGYPQQQYGVPPGRQRR